ncbi:hypothetical protein CEXT_225521 [Caerostris extrusa]|uniref:Uncharacterized protein n=1 Tax=Caerostris extrusa TaxID=172846 RepID=A0AAV4PN93_CAEEX|nr:hypothetical protein CEXT_225521 [Caerostris extrusa]
MLKESRGRHVVTMFHADWVSGTSTLEVSQTFLAFPGSILTFLIAQMLHRSVWVPRKLFDQVWEKDADVQRANAPNGLLSARREIIKASFQTHKNVAEAPCITGVSICSSLPFSHPLAPTSSSVHPPHVFL